MLIQKLSLPLLLSLQPLTLTSLLPRHALIVTSGNSTDPFLSAKLISLYSSFRRPDVAALVFLTSVPPRRRDAFLYNSIIQAHHSNSQYPSSLRLFRRMLASGSARPDPFTLPIVISGSAELGDAGLCSSIHSTTLKLGLFLNSIAVGSSLIYMYAKCRVIDHAFKVFDEMTERDVVSWTALVVGCVRNEECGLGLVCLRDMQRCRELPGGRAIECGLQACGSIEATREGMCLHGLSVKIGTGCFPSVRSSLLSMYSKCESLEGSVTAFYELPERDIVSWTEVAGICARKGLVRECAKLFRDMVGSGVLPDGVFLGCLLMGFAGFSCVYGGKAFHGIILRRSLELVELVANSLLSMYCKLELMTIAEKVFRSMSIKNPDSWNLMVSGYAKKGLETKCLDLFREMQCSTLGLETDLNSLVSVIFSCSQLGALTLGLSVYCYAIKNTVDGDQSVANSLVGMYGRCGRLDLSRTIFDRMDKDIISWNTLISAYSHMGHSDNALSLFDQMLLKGMKPNLTTLMSILSACSHMAALDRGRWIHDYIKENGLEFDVSLSTALVDMYAKCGQLEISRLLFDSMIERDVVTYNVMISAYGIHGDANEALEIFGEMQRKDLKPNGVTFLALLSACSHGGLVGEGKNLFSRMRDYSISPTLKHYACMVDLLGRSGNLSEAEEMVISMPIEPDGGIWGALLNACNMHSNVEMGERIAKRALELEPENDGYYVLMSNTYGCIGKWEEVERLRGVMKGRGLRKRSGWSSVELEGKSHVFAVGEKSHPQSENIYTALEALGRNMEEWSNYMGRLQFSLLDFRAAYQKRRIHLFHPQMAKKGVISFIFRQGAIIPAPTNLKYNVFLQSFERAICTLHGSVEKMVR